MNASYKPLNPLEEIERHGARLPHWQQTGLSFFVTFRLGDSIPKERLDRLEVEREVWRVRNPPPLSPELERDYHERFSKLVDAWLDELHGACILRDGQLRSLLSEVLLRFDGVRLGVHSFVIMPNHVHVLFTIGEGGKLEAVVKAWKGASARAINEVRGTHGELWQGDYFDRLIRDGEHFWNCARYIRRNPKKAKLSPHEFTLHEHDEVRRTLDERGA